MFAKNDDKLARFMRDEVPEAYYDKDGIMHRVRVRNVHNCKLMLDKILYSYILKERS